MTRRISTYLEDYLTQFLTALRLMTREDQDLMIGYFLIGKTQTQLRIVTRTTSRSPAA